MSVTLLRPDGLHILGKATLQQLSEDEQLPDFASGLILTALAQIYPRYDPTQTLAGTLYDVSLPVNPLLVTLLVLDAEAGVIVDDERRIFPLSGFMSYRSRLAPDKFSINALRLPPLNPDGHYRLTTVADGFCFAVRLDLHPDLKVTGHVRLAVSSPTQVPVRLQATEHRLDRQVLTEELIETAVALENEDLAAPLTQGQQTKLIEVLKKLIGDEGRVIPFK
jgi:CO/xanthine dehydrogenase FAD-binding subunit